MIILNNGLVPVRVAGRWLQPGETAEVDMAVALRLMAANPDVVEPGKQTDLAGDNKPTEGMAVIVEPPTATKRKK